MSYFNVSHRSRGRYYMSPVLLDHHNLKWIWLSAGLLLFVTFFAGYIVGFEKSNNKWLARLDPVEITLPSAQVSELSDVEPKIPEIEEPGASIDVDSVDKPVLTKAVVKTTEIKPSGIKAAFIEKKQLKPEAKTSASPKTPVEVETVKESVSPGSVPAVEKSIQNKQDIEPLSKPPTEATVIVDDASEETARYTIQTGMYRSYENAAAKVELLINSNLSAYLQEFKNKNNEMRYNVRFGYFSSYSNAAQALNIYRQSHSDVGYVASYNSE